MATASTIAAITTYGEIGEPPSARLLRLSAQRAAEKLGYHFEVYRVHVGSRRSPVLEALLHETHVAGVLFLSLQRGVRATNFLDWSRFSVMCATTAMKSPRFDQAEPDHFENAREICAQLAARGCRILAFSTGEGDLSLPATHFHSAVSWSNARHAGAPMELALLSPRDRRRLVSWFEESRPDAIVCGDDKEADFIAEELGLERIRGIAFAITNHIGMPQWQGVDRRYDALGEAAISHLHTSIQSGRKGIPKTPTVATVKGQWIAAQAAPGARLDFALV